MQTRENELKELLAQLHSYFVMLAEKEPKKLLQRYKAYFQIMDAIEDNTKSVSTLCKKLVEELNEKGMGRQALSSLLNELSLVQPSEREILLKAFQELEGQRNSNFITSSAKFHSDLRTYAFTLTDQLKDGLIDASMVDKTIDSELSGKKLAIANHLMRVLDDENASILDFTTAVVKADVDHKQALKGTYNKEQRLGGLITTAKNLAKQYFPAEYAEAKSNLQKSGIKEEKIDKDAEQEIKSALQALDNYFVMLARAEPKKLLSRYGEYMEFRNNILDDLKDDKGHDLAKGDPLVYGMASVIAQCKTIASKYGGTGGREAYAKTLTGLQTVLKGYEDGNAEQGFKLLQKVQKEIDAEKKQMFLDAAAELITKIDEKYIPKLDKELKATGFFAKKINKDVSNSKKDIAEDLRNALEVAIATPKVKSKDKGKEKDGSSSASNNFDDKVRTLVGAVLYAENANKEAIKGENASEGRLGKLITEAKALLQQYYPAYYAEGKDNFGKSKEFKVEL